MTTLVGRYKQWFDKTTKNIKLTKGEEGSDFLSRIQKLNLREDLFGVQQHIDLFLLVLIEFASERKNLKWVEHLLRDCVRQKDMFDALVSIEGADAETAVGLLVDGQDVEGVLKVVRSK